MLKDEVWRHQWPIYVEIDFLLILRIWRHKQPLMTPLPFFRSNDQFFSKVNMPKVNKTACTNFPQGREQGFFGSLFWSNCLPHVGLKQLNNRLKMCNHTGVQKYKTKETNIVYTILCTLSISRSFKIGGYFQFSLICQVEAIKQLTILLEYY